jgi:hypothetical protein
MSTSYSLKYSVFSQQKLWKAQDMTPLTHTAKKIVINAGKL